MFKAEKKKIVRPFSSVKLIDKTFAKIEVNMNFFTTKDNII